MIILGVICVIAIFYILYRELTIRYEQWTMPIPDIIGPGVFQTQPDEESPSNRCNTENNKSGQVSSVPSLSLEEPMSKADPYASVSDDQALPQNNSNLEDIYMPG